MAMQHYSQDYYGYPTSPSKNHISQLGVSSPASVSASMSSYDAGTSLTGSYRPGGMNAVSASSGYSMPQPSGYGGQGSVSGYGYGSSSGYPQSGSVSGYPATGSTSGYQPQGSTSGYQPQGSTSGYQPQGSTSGYQPQGSTSGYPSTGQGYSGSVSGSGYPSVSQPAPSSGSTATYPTTQSTYPSGKNQDPVTYTGSQQSYPKGYSASTSSYPANAQPASTFGTQKSYAPSNYTAARSQHSLAPSLSRMRVPGRTGAPPRLRPWMIVLVTMFVGLMFIGVVLTVVAHWPGFTSIGADPLEIVGPVMLALGGVGIIVAIVLSVVHSSQEKKEFGKKLAKFQQSQRSLYASRMTMQSEGPPEGLPVGLPSSSRQASVSNYQGSQYGAASDSGVPSTHTYNSTNMSYEPDSDASQKSDGKFEVYKIETMPDPNARAQDGSQVPQPVRARSRDHKKKTTADPNHNQQGMPSLGRNSPLAGGGAISSPGMTEFLNESGASIEADQANAAPRRHMQDYSRSQEGYDMFAKEGGASAENGEKKKKKKKHKDKSRKREAEALQASAAPGQEGNGNGGYHAHAEDDGGFNQPQEPLRIAIRTQPGAQVSITPGYGSGGQPTQLDQQQSTETEI